MKINQEQLEIVNRSRFALKSVVADLESGIGIDATFEATLRIADALTFLDKMAREPVQ